MAHTVSRPPPTVPFHVPPYADMAGPYPLLFLVVLTCGAMVTSAAVGRTPATALWLRRGGTPATATAADAATGTFAAGLRSPSSLASTGVAAVDTPGVALASAAVASAATRDRQNNGHPGREEIPFRPLLRHGA